ncbi:hypothetical protein Q0M94_19210 (plasmid) [Deinococcus radiomollis]|uniref:hypothetical protein n=1 Tax=Deinococcus radiomollis TaxID=468916 RepID=UPI0038929AB9
MQVESTTLNLLVRTNSGSPARPVPTYSVLRPVHGTFQQMNWKKFQSEYKNSEGWVEGGTYIFYTVEVFNIGDELEYQGVRYSIKGIVPGRMRNQYHLLRTSDAA